MAVFSYEKECTHFPNCNLAAGRLFESDVFA